MYLDIVCRSVPCYAGQITTIELLFFFSHLAESKLGVELAGLVLALDMLAALFVVVFECFGDALCVI